MGGNLKRLYYLGINVLSAIHGMSAIWDVCYWEVSLYFLQMFPKDSLSKNITLEYDLSCIIGKDSISFSQKYDVFSRRKVKDDLSQKILVNMFSVYSVKMVFLFPTIIKLPFYQKSEDYLLPKNTL